MSILYTASATTKAGRNGHVETSDGLVKLDLSVPKSMGGPGKPNASNPEQLFAAGYSACFGGAIDFVAGRDKVHIGEVTVTADVSFNKDDSGFFISVVLKPSIAGVDHKTAEELVHKAHEVCPYSKATRGNVKVDFEIA
jgi:Ohr subfamily peroxiredoxin